MSVPISREKAVFDAALEVTDPAQRKLFLDQTCAGDAELRAAVEELLATQGDAEQFFAESASALTTIAGEIESAAAQTEGRGELATDEKPSTVIGRYKLLQKIGEGGCGVVYMAEQKEPVRRRVALKVIKLGMDTKNVIARFEAERQALAMMDHPNIARVFDAGATETGRPFFVMELVAGVRITEYCDQNQLGLEQRLELFIQICHAIQHAHQKGIIHRDIKPSNILVTLHDGVPVPKVIDFGIAKATEERLTDKTLFTAHAQLIGTPDYMSPEQVELSGLGVDTRSDIYSLGVLLYELLTGKTPFDTKELLKSGVDEMRRTLREREPSTPSSRLRTLAGEELAKTAIQRHVEPPQLLSQLRGDLDWIIMKALEKDRNRRYETANGLAMDIQRYLDDEPVLARPPSRLYRFQKLMRRHRMFFLSGAAVALALLLGTIISTRLFLKERDARASEARLRRDAELREKSSHIAVLVTQRRFDEADEILGDVPLNKPSIEVAAELRALGDWHAVNGRWQKAAARLGTLVHEDQLDGPDLMASDKLRLAAALLKAGDRRGYEQLRQTVIATFAPASDATAYSIVKIGALLPPEPAMLQSLVSGAEPFAAKFPTEAELRPNPVHAAQWSEALALLEYRRGNFDSAIGWCGRCQGYPLYDASMIATTLIIKAMSDWRTDHYWAAVVDWTEAYELIQAESRNGIKMGTSPSSIFPGASAPEYLESSWFDWAIANLLMHECDEMIAQTDEALALGALSKPLPEKAAMIRALGDWHAIRGEWEQARQRFGDVRQSSQMGTEAAAALDYFGEAIASLQLGDETGFLRLREEAIRRFKDTDNIDISQRVLELSLLRPVSKTTVGNLRPFARVLARKLTDTGQTKEGVASYSSWYSMLLGLLEYRDGNQAKALDLCRRSLDESGFVSLPTATDRVIMAMCFHELGDQTAARSELDRASSIAERGLNHGFDKWYWREWVCVRILLREATGLMPDASGPAEPTTR